MRIYTKIEKKGNLETTLKTRMTRYLVAARIRVSFTAPYALFVHENMEIWPPGMRLLGKPRPKGHQGNYWEPNGQPKFLETPARRMKDEFVKIVIGVMKSGGTVVQALYRAGEALKVAAQALCPVDKGVLRDSAVCEVE